MRFIVQKILYLVPTLIGITLVAFAFIHAIPGDPVLIMAGERGISPARHAELMAQLGLDKPLWQQYISYIWQILHGDFGISYVSKEPVLSEFMQLFPATLELACCAIVLAVFIGVPAGTPINTASTIAQQASSRVAGKSCINSLKTGSLLT